MLVLSCWATISAYVFLVLRSCCNSTLEPFSVLDHANLEESKPGICPIFPYLERSVTDMLSQSVPSSDLRNVRRSAEVPCSFS